MPIQTYIPLTPEDLKKHIAECIQNEFSRHKLIKLPEPPKDEYIDVATTAKILFRERSRVYAYVRSGLLIAYKLKGRRGMFFKKNEVEQSIMKVDLLKNFKVKEDKF